jgi:hypothetical protein
MKGKASWLRRLRCMKLKWPVWEMSHYGFYDESEKPYDAANLIMSTSHCSPRKIRDSFPGCPPKEENLIAEHACEKHSGRVGRTEAAKDLDETAVRLAVVAHIRHAHTNYDRLLAAGILSREDARLHVKPQIDSVFTAWKRELLSQAV